MSRYLIYVGDDDDSEVTITEVLKDKNECRYNMNSKCFCNEDYKRLGKTCRENENTCKHFKEETMEEIDG